MKILFITYSMYARTKNVAKKAAQFGVTMGRLLIRLA